MLRFILIIRLLGCERSVPDFNLIGHGGGRQACLVGSQVCGEPFVKELARDDMSTRMLKLHMIALDILLLRIWPKDGSCPSITRGSRAVSVKR